MREIDDESLIEDDLYEIFDEPIKVKRIPLAQTQKQANELYSDHALRFHRTQAMIDTLASLKKGLALIAQWETKLLGGEEVSVKTTDLMPLMAVTQPASLRRKLVGIKSTHSKWKVWRWKDVRMLVINRFTQVVMHSYLAALE